VILVVEDEPVVSDVACRMLKVIGHESVCVRTGAEAVQELQRASYDAVLLDMTLPDGGSHDVMDAVSNGLKLVIMSGHVRESLDIGELPFLAKPFQLSELERLFPCAS
jgi:two-component system response regulator MprA